MRESDEPTRAILQRIADSLDVPIERFFTDSMPLEAEECLRLWFKIKTPDGRYRALEALRVIADEEIR